MILGEKPRWRTTNNLSPDDSIITCERCANWRLRKWHGHNWCWCSMQDGWICPDWICCKSYVRLGLLHHLMRGSETRGGIGYNPLPPYMARELPEGGKDEGRNMEPNSKSHGLG